MYFKSLLETESNEYEIHENTNNFVEDNKNFVYQLSLNFFLVYFLIKLVFNTGTVFSLKAENTSI